MSPSTPDSGLPQTTTTSNFTLDSSLALSPVELNRGKLKLHTELIQALQSFATQRMEAGGGERRGGETRGETREGVLEQALVEQNRILEMMRSLVTSLEAKNKLSRNQINSQARKINEMITWEARAKAAEEQLHQMRNSHGVVGSSKAGMISFAAIAGFEKVLAKKDQLIASLQAKLESVPPELRSGVAPQESLVSATSMTSIRVKLEAERVRGIELEEELSSLRDELGRVRSELSEKCSILTKQESEILHLRHEVGRVEKFSAQQQKVAMSLQTSLRDKDLQLTSLTRALNKEKKTSEQLRNSQPPSLSLQPVDPSVQPTLFDQVLGRTINTIELRRLQTETQLGFSFTKVELPVSSKAPGLVVRAVKEGSIAHDVLYPGDEILEVNGFSCRSAAQSNAIECLEKAVGTLKLVVARDPEPMSVGLHLHSTPVKDRSESTMWATAFSNLEASSTTVSEVTHSSPSFPVVVSIPSNAHSPTLPVIEEDQLSPSTDETDGLRGNLRESQLESELEVVKRELDNLQMEFDLTKGENFELQQQASLHAAEMDEIQEQVSELQQLLVQVEEKVSEEQTKAGSLQAENESLNKQLQALRDAHETACELQANLETVSLEKKEKIRELKEEIAGLSCGQDELRSDLSKKNAQIEDLTEQLRNKTTECDARLLDMHQQHEHLLVELQTLQESSAMKVESTQEELKHLTEELGSVRAVLLESEMKEDSMKVEMRELKQTADLANQQLAEVERNYNRLFEEMGTYKQLVEDKTVEKETLTIGLKAAQSKLKDNKDMILRLQNEVDNLRRSTAKLQNEKDRVEEAKGRVEANLRVEVSERISWEEKLRSSTHEKDELFHQLENSIAEAIALQQEVETLNIRLQEAHGSIETAKKREGLLEKEVRELSTAKRSLEMDLTRRIELLKAEKEVLEQEVNRTRVVESEQSSADLAAHEIARIQGELHQQRKALVASEGERAQLRHEFEALKKKESKASHQVESLRTEHEALTHTVSILKTAQEEVDKECSAQQKRAEELEKNCTRLKEEAASLEQSLELLQREKEEGRAEIKRLLRSQQEWEDQTLDLQLQLGQLSREVEQKVQALQESAATCEQLREELVLERAKGEQLKSNADFLQGRVDNLQAAKKQTESLVASMEFVHQQDQGKLGHLAEVLQGREEEMKRLSRELEAVQSETQSQLQQLRAENTSLSESVEGLEKQLQATEKTRVTEVSDLRKQLHSQDGQLNKLKENLRVQEEANDELKTSLSQLQTTQKSLDEAGSIRSQLEMDNKRLQDWAAQIESQKKGLEDANVSLTSECAGLKQQLKQSMFRVDDLSARLQALEMNLEVSNRSLEENERVTTELKEESANLKAQLSQATLTLETLKEQEAKMSLDLHTQDEVILQLKTNLDLCQSENVQLQEVLITTQNAASTQTKKVESLEGVRRDLESTIKQLKERQEMFTNLLQTLEAAKTAQLGKHAEETAKLAQQIADLQAREKDHMEQIHKLDSINAEAQNTVKQLQGGQEALSHSLGKLGDEKDVEIVKLGSQVTELESSLTSSNQQLSLSRASEAELQTQVQQLEEGYRDMSEQLKELEVENEQLRCESELHKSTVAQISELSVKVSSLEDAVGAKSNRLAELELILKEKESELRAVQEENESLLGKVSELASVKLSLVEKSVELEKVQGRLASEVRKSHEVAAERDQLLSMLRKLEVEKHTEVVRQPTPQLTRGADKQKLIELLKEKEEEAYRLREYVGKLLTNVVEKAPFVLENMH